MTAALEHAARFLQVDHVHALLIDPT